MGLFEHFPYANFHELNLDWLLQKMKELSARMDALDGGNIRDELADLLQQMIRDGSLAALLQAIALDGRLVTGKYLETVPAQPSHYTVYPDLTRLSAGQIYDLYDAMQGENFVKTEWGTDETGLELSYYTFTCDTERRTYITQQGVQTGEHAYYRNLADTANRLVLFSGIHGNEKQSVWALYHIVRAILAGDGPIFEYLKHNVNIIVVPCVNPWGINNNERVNSRDVDINRNFPYGWDDYTPPANAVGGKGSAAGSEKGTQLCMAALYSINTRQEHNGAVIIDAHDFQANTTTYAGRFAVSAATEPELRIALDKAGMVMLDYLESAYPDYIADAARPIQVTNLYDAPTLENWAYHQGFRYTMLQENRTNLTGTQYDEASHNCVWASLSLAVCSVAVPFIGHHKQYLIDSLANIGMDKTHNLVEIVEAMPPRATFTVGVYSADTLLEDMPVDIRGALTIDSGNWADDRVIRLTYQTFDLTTRTFTAVAYGVAGALTISEWTELQPVT